MNFVASGVKRLLPKPIKRKLRRGLVLFRRHFVVPVRRRFIPDIPIFMITGTVGKTTTTLMLSHILKEAGHTVGTTCTEGIIINGERRKGGDCAGYDSVGVVLRDPSVTAAVFETARGGLIKQGMYVDTCQASALLNIGYEQVGIDGVNTLDEMARVKQRVINAARNVIVLNADDAHCVCLMDEYPRERLILFSMEESNDVVRKHVASGGIAYVRATSDTDRIERRTGDRGEVLVEVADIPACYNGIFHQNIANAMAAAALAEGVDLSLETVASALRTVKCSVDMLPGRLNIVGGYRQQILFDYGTSIPALQNLVDSLSRMPVKGRRILGLMTPGDRPWRHYADIGTICAKHFDRFVCYDHVDFLRGLEPEESARQLKRALVAGGADAKSVSVTHGYPGLVNQVSEISEENDLVILIVSHPEEFMAIFQDHFGAHELH